MLACASVCVFTDKVRSRGGTLQNINELENLKAIIDENDKLS